MVKEFTDRFEGVPGLEGMTLEEAQERREALRERRETPDRNLEGLMRAQEHKEREQYFNSLTKPESLVARVKEYLGFGRAYEYQKHLNLVDVMAASMQQVSTNTQKALSSYGAKALELATTLAQDKEELALNICLINGYEERKAALQADLGAIEKRSIAGTAATAEAMQLRAKLLDIEKNLLSLNSENNDIAVRLVTQSSMRETYEHVQTKVFAQHVAFEKQRTAFNEHREYAHANEALVKGLGQISAKEIYARSAVLVEQLEGMQDRLHKTLFEELPNDFKIKRMPASIEPSPGKPYWQSVVREIFGTTNGRAA